MALELFTERDEFSEYSDFIRIDGNKIIREQIDYRILSGQKEADKILTNIIVYEGFKPKFTKDCVIFSNSTDIDVMYFYHPKTFEIEKVKSIVIDFIS